MFARETIDCLCSKEKENGRYKTGTEGRKGGRGRSKGKSSRRVVFVGERVTRMESSVTLFPSPFFPGCCDNFRRLSMSLIHLSAFSVASCRRDAVEELVIGGGWNWFSIIGRVGRTVGFYTSSPYGNVDSARESNYLRRWS